MDEEKGKRDRGDAFTMVHPSRGFIAGKIGTLAKISRGSDKVNRLKELLQNAKDQLAVVKPRAAKIWK